ncbi:MAG: gamma-glutamylcyclotransferase, partial [Rhodospirillaceae bacterium]|nr:gamma-glutamylcyclotransferase [Rhodospirillaceae bacterium]
SEKIKYLLQGTGTEGRSLEYLANIVDQLGELGIADEGLSELLSQASQAD